MPINNNRNMYKWFSIHKEVHIYIYMGKAMANYP